jgi:hypothetical protein
MPNDTGRNKKTIIIYARDAGSANCVIPIIPLLEKDFRIALYANGVAYEKMISIGLLPLVLSANLNFENFIKKHSPAIIITGTEPDPLIRKLWIIGKELGVITVAILDQWLNYEARFPLSSSFHMPEKIFVPDDFAKKELIALGINPSKIISTGHPLLSSLHTWNTKFKNRRPNFFRKKLGLPLDSYILTFASEPIAKTHGEKNLFGYNEITILKELIHTLEKINAPNLLLAIKPHPSDLREKYLNISTNLSVKILNPKLHSWDLIKASDCICGMSSMFLIESVLLEKPILSIQLNLKYKNPFVLDRANIVKSIATKKELFQSLQKTVLQTPHPLPFFPVKTNVCERISSEIHKLTRNTSC